jgi:hypothetical protein
LPFAFAPAKRLMRILGPVVGPRNAVLLCCEAYGSDRWRVRPKRVGNHPARCEALRLEQPLHQPSCGLGVAPALNEEIQNRAFVVDGAPEPGAFSPDDDRHSRLASISSTSRQL